MAEKHACAGVKINGEPCRYNGNRIDHFDGRYYCGYHYDVAVRMRQALQVRRHIVRQARVDGAKGECVAILRRVVAWVDERNITAGPLVNIATEAKVALRVIDGEARGNGGTHETS